MTEIIDNAVNKAIEESKGKQDKKIENATYYIKNVLEKDITRFADAGDRYTGFDTLDKMQGALYSGLYVLASIPSLGKTTFAMQVADNLAKSGQDVLFFSLEMSTFEMISKSLARIIKIKDRDSKITSLKIRRGFTTKEIENAKKEYMETAGGNMYIIEGGFNYTIENVKQDIQNHIKQTGKRPIVFIDYLQILKPTEDTQNIKETIDTAITELKILSRECNITIFVISSLNRQNYGATFDYEALKESGGIEYTADVIWGLQLNIINSFKDTTKKNDIREKVKKAKAENPRKVQIVCVKNRYGRANYTADFLYYPDCDYFIEGDL